MKCEIKDIEKREKECIAPFENYDGPFPKYENNTKSRLSLSFSHMTKEDIKKRDEFYMRCALSLARLALECGEVPVGAVIVRENKIISFASNRKENEKNALAHAEIIATDKACRSLGGWRLPGCEMYVSLEPCVMCGGAAESARIPRLIFSSRNTVSGAFGSVTDVNSLSLNHSIIIEEGILQNESSALLESFFLQKRKK